MVRYLDPGKCSTEGLDLIQVHRDVVMKCTRAPWQAASRVLSTAFVFASSHDGGLSLVVLCQHPCKARAYLLSGSRFNKKPLAGWVDLQEHVLPTRG